LLPTIHREVLLENSVKFVVQTLSGAEVKNIRIGYLLLLQLWIRFSILDISRIFIGSPRRVGWNIIAKKGFPMIRFQNPQGVFQFRCVAVILHEGRILLHKAEADDFWALPGGRVEFFEFVQDTLVRELNEELGCSANIIRPLWFVENFFTYHAQDCHEISYYFLANITDDVILNQDSEFYGIEVDCKLIFKWFDLQSLTDLSLYPIFLKSELLNLPSGLTSIRIDERNKI